MNVLSVKLQRLAKEDLRNAHLWYENQTAGLGADFVGEVIIALRKAAAQPNLYRVIVEDLGIRRILVRRFPYKAFFTVEPDRIVVHAIVSAHQSERSWQQRLD